jgi:hypothetical protein
MSAEEIGAVVRAIVDTQLSESRFAAERAASGRVRAITAHAARDFGVANETLTAIESLQPFDVEDTEASRSLRTASERSQDQLRSATADDFDRMYVSAAIVRSAHLIVVLDRLTARTDATVLRRGMGELRSTLADTLRDAQEAKAQLALEP